MKVKFKFTKEVKIKSAIIGMMLIMLVLSFFFANEIELMLGWSYAKRKHEVSEEKLNSKSSYSVTYIDVGQGNSAFVEFPDGKTMLIDSGDKAYVQKVEKVINDAGVKTIDYLVATHADSDHIGGFADLLEMFDFKNIYRPFQIAGTGTSFETFKVFEDEDLKAAYEYYVDINGNKSKISRVTTNDYKNFVSAIYNETYIENNVEVLSDVSVFYDGLKIDGENYKFEFFAPEVRENSPGLEILTDRTSGYATVGYGAGNSNGNSAIMLLSIENETFLFTGDAPWTDGSSTHLNFAELNFLKSLNPNERVQFQNISVYLAGHHGAKNSSGEELLNFIDPSYVVISVGLNNAYEHPSSDVLDRVKNTDCLESDYLLRTDKMGSITFGFVDGELVYSLETTSNIEKMQISWFMLGTIIFVFLTNVVVFVKIKTGKK